MTEMVVVITIIGVLAALAFPSYRIQMLKIKNQEAVRILMALWEAQKDYYRDNGSYTSNPTNLAIDIPVAKNFFHFVIFNGNFSKACTGSGKIILAMMQSKDFSYLLYVLEDGRIVCGNALMDCHDPICIKMGFTDNW